MTDEEIDQLIIAIEGLLSDLELDAIVAQERVLATEGEVRFGEDLRGRNDVDILERFYQEPSLDLAIPQYGDLPGPKRRPTKVRFTKDDVRVTPLDARDRLRNLLDLIEVATAGTLAMERIVHDEMTSITVGRIIFVDSPESELRGATQKPWTLAIDSEFQTAATHAANVVSLLDSLRAQAGIERGPELTRGVDDGSEGSWISKEERP